MRGAMGRLRKLAREIPQFDTTEFDPAEFVELTRLLFKEKFDIGLDWRTAHFLTYASSAKISWCRIPDRSKLSALQWLTWHEKAEAIDRWYVEDPSDDVAKTTLRKLHRQLGLWELFVNQTNWVWY